MQVLVRQTDHVNLPQESNVCRKNTLSGPELTYMEVFAPS